MSLTDSFIANGILPLYITALRSGSWIGEDLSLQDILAILAELHVGVPHLGKKLLNLPHRGNFFNFFLLSFQEGLSHLLDLELLLRAVWVVLNSAPTCEGVVHLELLLEVAHFSLVFLEKQ